MVEAAGLAPRRPLDVSIPSPGRIVLWSADRCEKGRPFAATACAHTPKARPDDHWSTPVNLVSEVAGGAEAPAGEKENDDENPPHHPLRHS
jgi:hypothetical protein